MNPFIRTRAAKSTVAMVAMLLITACGQENNVASRIDGEGHRRTLQEVHLSHWLKVLPTANGFFNTTVNRRWELVDPQSGDITGQTRAIYILATGYQLTGNPEYLEQVKRGSDFLLRFFRDPINGGWYTAVGSTGTKKIDNKRLYGHAFVIFSLAHAYRVTKDQRYFDAAIETWHEINSRFADGKGGYKAAFNQSFTQLKSENTQNPIMHLYEAMLALFEASGSDLARQGANTIGDFVGTQLLQGQENGSARIPELYDANWQPLDRSHGGYIDIGHQFEWAYLFSIGEQAGLNASFAGFADRLLNYALAKGYDTVDSGVFTSESADGEINRKKGFWQQAEALRALMHHAVIRHRNDLWARVTQMTEFIDGEFLDHDHGGWYEATATECRKGHCSDRQPDAYHMTAMHSEAIRLASARH